MKKKLFRERYRTEKLTLDKDAGEVKIKSVKPKRRTSKKKEA